MSTALALLSGALFAASFPKFGHPAFAWIALSPLILAVTLSSARPAGTAGRTFALGLACGLVYFGGTLYWVVGVMQIYGALPSWVAVLIALLLASYLALYPGLFALLLRRAVRRFGVAGIWLSPLLWVATEWTRSWFGGGFPWVLLGASQASVVPIVQVTSIVGVHGLSILVALVSTAAAALAIRRSAAHWRAAAAVGALLVIAGVWGIVRVSAGTLTKIGVETRIGLVQGSIDQAQKYDPKFRDAILTRYVDLSRRAIGAGAQMVIWPEASTPFFFDLDAAGAAPVRRLAAETRTPFLIGTDEYTPPAAGAPERYFNSAVLLGADGRSHGVYRKMHLVPFGEYVPLKRALFFVGPLIEAVSDFSAGTEPTVFDAAGRRVSVAICYESVYPSIAAAFVDRGSQLLATITNDAWFDRSSAAYQHFEQGALRAVEQGRYVVRAANTGISGAVDPYGRVLARTELFVPTSLTVDVRLLDDRTVYHRLGDVAAWLSFAAAAWVVATGRTGRLPGGRRGDAAAPAIARP